MANTRQKLAENSKNIIKQTKQLNSKESQKFAKNNCLKENSQTKKVTKKIQKKNVKFKNATKNIKKITQKQKDKGQNKQFKKKQDIQENKAQFQNLFTNNNNGNLKEKKIGEQLNNNEELKEKIVQKKQDNLQENQEDFSEQKILVGCLNNFNFNGEFDNYAGKELKRRSFKYDVEKNFNKFVKNMMNYDIVWLISTQQYKKLEQKNRFITEIGKFFKAKKSLFLWCYQTPYHQEANIILKHYFQGMVIEGNYLGNKIITKGKLGKGTFDENHFIGQRLSNFHEGFKISSPKNIHPDFKPFAYNSNNEPLVVYAEENENHGRIIVDCGTSKLTKFWWQKTGTAQYVSNANIWLTGRSY